MTALLIGPAAAAFIALLTADVELDVHDGAPPDLTPPPYVTVWCSLDGEQPMSLQYEPAQSGLRWTTHSVGASGMAARRVADRVRLAVLGKRLTVAGHAMFKITHEFGVPPQPNEQTGYQFVDVVDVWTADAVPG